MNDSADFLKARCWRAGRARRLECLVDGSNYFAALREALLNARHSVFILGWDIDSRMRLIGEETEPADGAPAELREFLAELVKRSDTLSIRLLLWDYSILYAAEREVLPAVSLGWRTPARIEFCLDDDLPVGASHHEKLVIVDDCVAFIGGLDLTIRRWDTPAHAPDDSRRVDPAGETYPPFHDLHAIVDGEPAAALACFCRERWQQVAKETLPPMQTGSDPWPASVEPSFTDVDVGIARTRAAHAGREELREIESVYLEAIGKAERFIYIENQYLTATTIADALIDRLGHKEELEVLCVCPREPGGWLEAKTMGAGRERFMGKIAEAGLENRVIFAEPVVGDGGEDTPVMVHSKLLIVDDQILTLGSANLNNRSMGFDTECNLVLYGSGERERSAITALRNQLLAEHGGKAADAVDAILKSDDGLAEKLEKLAGDRHRLSRIERRRELDDEFARSVAEVADPEAPFEIEQALGDGFGGRMQSSLKRRLAGLAGGLALAGSAVAVWRLTPLSQLLDVDRLTSLLDSSTSDPMAALLLMGLFVAGGLLAFPVTVLIAASAVLLGPWLGLATATAGVLLSAAAAFLVGARATRLTHRLVPVSIRSKVRTLVDRRGIAAVAIIRNIPVAPFTVVNLLAAQTGIGLLPFLAGTLIGMLPGIAMLTFLGDRLRAILEDPSAGTISLLIAAVLAWVSVALLLQKLANRFRDTDS